MIEINNLTNNLIDKKFLKKISKFVLDGESKKKEKLFIVFVGQDRIKRVK